jgi:hypothetical protein
VVSGVGGMVITAVLVAAVVVLLAVAGVLLLVFIMARPWSCWW